MAHITEIDELSPLENESKAPAKGYWQTTKHHTQQILKGFTLLGIGAAGYAAWRWIMVNSVTSSAENQDLSFSFNPTDVASPAGATGLSFTRAFSALNQAFQFPTADASEITCPPPGNLAEEFQVNDYVLGEQSTPVIDRLADGGFIITWSVPATNNIYARRYTAMSQPTGDGFQIDAAFSSRYYVGNPAVKTFPNGTTIIAWAGGDPNGRGISGQRYKINGGIVGGKLILGEDEPSNSKSMPAIGLLADGNWVVSWEQSAGSIGTDNVYGQRMTFDDTKIGTPLSTGYPSGYSHSPVVAGLADGSFLIVWASFSPNGLYAQRFSNNGTTFADPFLVNADTYPSNTYPTRNPALAVLTDKSVVITWGHNYRDEDSTGIYAKRYAADGSLLKTDFRVNSYSPNTQGKPSIASLKDGGYVIVWQSLGQDGNQYGIYGQRYAASNQKVGPEFRVNTYTPDSQQNPQVIGLDDGSFVVVWQSYKQDGDNEGIFAQRFAPNFKGLWNVFDANYPYVEDNPVALNRVFVSPTATYPLSVAMVITPATAGTLVSGVQPEGIDINFSAATGTWLISGNSTAAINQALTCLHFMPAANFDQNVTLHLNAQNSYQTDTFILTLPAQAVNDSPQLTVNRLVLNEDEAVVLTSDYLAATDVDNPVDNLMFIISNIQQGYFESINATGIPISQFSQKELRAGHIRFVPTGGSVAPSYWVAISDGNVPTTSVAGVIQFNQKPVLLVNTLSISSLGQSITVSSVNLAAFDNDTPSSQLQFIISELQQGYFALSAQPATPVLQFSQQQITNGEVRFVHDGSQSAPSYKVSVSDGHLTTTPAMANILFNPPIVFNNPPMLVINILPIHQGETKLITATELSATDTETPAGNLIFSLSAVEHGHFGLSPNLTISVTHFTQQQITDGQVSFVHDGSESAPSYLVSVNDGVITTSSVAAIVNFTPTPNTSNTNAPPEINIQGWLWALFVFGFGGGGAMLMLLAACVFQKYRSSRVTAYAQVEMTGVSNQASNNNGESNKPKEENKEITDLPDKLKNLEAEKNTANQDKEKIDQELTTVKKEYDDVRSRQTDLYNQYIKLLLKNAGDNKILQSYFLVIAAQKGEKSAKESYAKEYGIANDKVDAYWSQEGYQPENNRLERKLLSYNDVSQDKKDWQDEKLAEGSFGAVHILLDERKEKGVAVKAIKYAINKEHINRELAVLKNLKSPYVINFLGEFYKDIEAINHYCLIIELAICSIDRILIYELPTPFKIQMMLEIITGLDVLHTNKIVHGDLKPQNILLMENLHLKIADFGSAKKIVPEEGTTSTTSSTGFAGTYSYAAPESLPSPPAAPDLYAYGLIMWSLECKEIIQRDAKVSIRVASVTSGNEYNKLLTSLPGSCLPLFRKIIEKNCQPNPKDRWTSTETMEEIKQHAIFEPVLHENVLAVANIINDKEKELVKPGHRKFYSMLS